MMEEINSGLNTSLQLTEDKGSNSEPCPQDKCKIQVNDIEIIMYKLLNKLSCFSFSLLTLPSVLLAIEINFEINWIEINDWRFLGQTIL